MRPQSPRRPLCRWHEALAQSAETPRESIAVCGQLPGRDSEARLSSLERDASPHDSGAGTLLSEPCDLCVLMESRLQPLAVGVVPLPLGEHSV